MSQIVTALAFIAASLAFGSNARSPGSWEQITRRMGDGWERFVQRVLPETDARRGEDRPDSRSSDRNREEDARSWRDKDRGSKDHEQRRPIPEESLLGPPRSPLTSSPSSARNLQDLESTIARAISRPQPQQTSDTGWENILYHLLGSGYGSALSSSSRSYHPGSSRSYRGEDQSDARTFVDSAYEGSPRSSVTGSSPRRSQRGVRGDPGGAWDQDVLPSPSKPSSQSGGSRSIPPEHLDGNMTKKAENADYFSGEYHRASGARDKRQEEPDVDAAMRGRLGSRKDQRLERGRAGLDESTIRRRGDSGERVYRDGPYDREYSDERVLHRDRSRRDKSRGGRDMQDREDRDYQLSDSRYLERGRERARGRSRRGGYDDNDEAYESRYDDDRYANRSGRRDRERRRGKGYDDRYGGHGHGRDREEDYDGTNFRDERYHYNKRRPLEEHLRDHEGNPIHPQYPITTSAMPVIVNNVLGGMPMSTDTLTTPEPTPRDAPQAEREEITPEPESERLEQVEQPPEEALDGVYKTKEQEQQEARNRFAEAGATHAKKKYPKVINKRGGREATASLESISNDGLGTVDTDTTGPILLGQALEVIPQPPTSNGESLSTKNLEPEVVVRNSSPSPDSHSATKPVERSERLTDEVPESPVGRKLDTLPLIDTGSPMMRPLDEAQKVDTTMSPDSQRSGAVQFPSPIMPPRKETLLRADKLVDQPETPTLAENARRDSGISMTGRGIGLEQKGEDSIHKPDDESLISPIKLSQTVVGQGAITGSSRSRQSLQGVIVQPGDESDEEAPRVSKSHALRRISTGAAEISEPIDYVKDETVSKSSTKHRRRMIVEKELRETSRNALQSQSSVLKRHEVTGPKTLGRLIKLALKSSPKMTCLAVAVTGVYLIGIVYLGNEAAKMEQMTPSSIRPERRQSIDPSTGSDTSGYSTSTFENFEQDTRNLIRLNAWHAVCDLALLLLMHNIWNNIPDPDGPRTYKDWLDRFGLWSALRMLVTLIPMGVYLLLGARQLTSCAYLLNNPEAIVWSIGPDVGLTWEYLAEPSNSASTLTNPGTGSQDNDGWQLLGLSVFFWFTGLPVFLYSIKRVLHPGSLSRQKIVKRIERGHSGIDNV